MKPQTASNRDSPTPSKGNARKRKSDAQSNIKYVKPPTKRQLKKAAGSKKGKAKAEKPITENFKVTKATKKSVAAKVKEDSNAHAKETADTIVVAQPATPTRGSRVTRYKEEYLTKISPFAARNNPNLTPQRPPMEPFTSPVKSPPQMKTFNFPASASMITQSVPLNTVSSPESRPSSSDSNRSKMAISSLID
jgi:hypothetical protein